MSLGVCYARSTISWEFFQRSDFWPAGQLRFKSLERMTRCCTRSFTTTIQQESRPAIFDASGNPIDRTSASLPNGSVSP
jgi:hypothetical protein